MRSMRRLKCVRLEAWPAIAILLAAALPSLARAATPGEACVAISDDAQRLACYDAAFRRAASATTALATDGPTTDAASLATEPIEQFGMSPQMRLESDNQTALPQIEAKVTKVGYTTPDRRTFTLDNGQVWLQTETTPRLRVSPGDTVTIKRALMGSYLLVTAQSGATRARRIQ